MPRSDETLVRTVVVEGTPYATLIVFMSLRAQLTELALRS